MAQFGKETRRQKSVSHGTTVAITNAAQIGTGPFKQVAFAQYDPGAIGIETKMLFDGHGQFESIGEIGGRTVGDGNDEDVRVIVTIARGENDCARAILDAFLTPLTMFVQPEIGITDDEAGLRRRQAHGVQSGIRLSR